MFWLCCVYSFLFRFIQLIISTISFIRIHILNLYSRCVFTFSTAQNFNKLIFFLPTRNTVWRFDKKKMQKIRSYFYWVSTGAQYSISSNTPWNVCTRGTGSEKRKYRVTNMQIFIISNIMENVFSMPLCPTDTLSPVHINFTFLDDQK